MKTMPLLLLTALGLPGVAMAAPQTPAETPAAAPQTAPPANPATPPEAATPAPALPTTTALPLSPTLTPTQIPVTPQPSAATPPTPLPGKSPDSATVGVKKSDIVPANLFEKATPGQPLPNDPKEIHTLDDAIAMAFRRNPTILLARERALKTNKQVDQILAVSRPQISASGSYSRLANGNSAAITSGSFSPSQLSNPFSVGLSVATPGATPVTLSTTSGTSGGSGSSAATAAAAGSASVSTSTASSASTAGTTASATGRSEAIPSSAPTRQTTGGNGTGNNNNNSFGGTNLNQASARLSVTQAIDITGIIKTVQDLGDLQEALSRIDLARARQQTALDVKNAYFNLLRAQAFVAVDEAAVADSEELLRVTTAQKSVGVAAQYDVLRAQTQLENNRQALISSRNQVAISKNALANVIGIDPSTPVDPQPLPVPALPTLDEESLLKQAMTLRPEYLEADINYLVAQKNIRLARRNLEPYLNAALSGGYNPTAGSGVDNKATASVGLVLTVPLSDGGATKAAVEAARSDARGAGIQKDQFVRGIKAEVQQAIVAVRDANERSLSIAATVTTAQEALRLANVRFKAGVGTQLDVNDAQSALIQSQTNQVSALFDYLGALARLQRAVGTPE